MRRQVLISPQTISTEEKIAFPIDTTFWEPLWSKFSKKAVTMEIHCWSAEEEVENQLNKKMSNNGLVPGTETLAFTTDLTKDIIVWMATQSYDKHGGLKWFTIFLYNSLGDSVVSIEHYGGEIHFYVENDREIEKVKSFFNGEFSVNIFEFE